MARRASKIGHITQRLSKGLKGLRRDLVALGRVIQAVAEASRGLGSNGAGRLAGTRVGRRRRRRLTPADRARLKVQGEYLGLVRHLSVRDRARVKAIRSRKGYPPAIKVARRLISQA